MKIEQLLQESDEKRLAFEALGSHSPHDPACVDFVRSIEGFLRNCIAEGRFLPPGSQDRRTVSGIIEEWNSRLRRFEHRPTALDRLADFEADAGIVLDVECPYPGLDAYGFERRGSFFGRESLAREYVERLIKSRIFLIVGASGSGKSSLALAGIRPLVRERHPEWIFTEPFTPGAAPLTALANAVSKVIGRSAHAQALAAELRHAPASATAQLEVLCEGRPLMLVVDQFEELFTLCRDVGEQQAFAQVLLALSQPQAGTWTCHSLLTLRTDHLARFDSSDALSPLYKQLVEGHNFEHLPALGFADIRRAIVEPAKAVGLRFIPADIPDRLASETAGLANGLPLLQYALRRLWDTRPRDEQGQPLDLVNEAMVAALPDVQRALGTTANALFEKLSAQQQAICDRAMLELVVLDETFEEPLRRRRGRGELRGVLTARFPGAEEDIALLEARFSEAGLLRTFGKGDEAQIEITHEALLRHWKHINGLVSSEDAKQRLHAVKQIAREAMDWNARGKSEDRLKQQGQPLALALEYLEDGWFGDAGSAEYLRACKQRELAAQEQARQLESERLRAREAEKERLKAQIELEKRKKFGWAILVILVVAISAVALWVNDQANTKEARLMASKASRDLSLEASASLSSRLPVLEALDLTYTLAKRGGSDFRFALAHALERMDDAWQVGVRDASLYPTGDGSALLQLDAKVSTLNVDLIDAEGKPQGRRFVFDLKERFDQLAQAQVGPAIQGGGDLAGKHWIVLAYRNKSGEPGYTMETYLLESTADPRRIAASEADARLGSYHELSKIRFHHDGRHAIFSGIDYGGLRSAVFELRLGGIDDVRMVPMDDPAGEDKCDARLRRECADRRIVTAVAYGYGDQAEGSRRILTGRLNGEVYCGGNRLIDPAAKDPGDPEYQPENAPVRTIASHPKLWQFGTVNAAGIVRVSHCPQHEQQMPRRFALPANPDSLSLIPVTLKGDSAPIPLLTYFDTDRQLRCFSGKRRGTEDWPWYVCNAAHPVSAAVMLPQQWQLAIEEPGVGIVRRYPSEGRFDAEDKRGEARAANGLTVRWTQPRGKTDDPRLDPTDNLAWETDKSGDIRATGKRIVTNAAISSGGTKLAWIEQRRTPEYLRELNPLIETTVSRIRTMDAKEAKTADWLPFRGRAIAVAIDDMSRVAHVQRGATPGDPAELYLEGIDRPLLTQTPDDGVPRCIAFSPDGNYLILGTAGGGLYRIATATPEAGPSKVEALSLKPEAAGKGGSVRASDSVTACGVADDGMVVAGYADGQVRVFAREGKPRLLTERTVYRFNAPIRQVSVAAGRIAALGEAQINNCTSPGLPGQALRVWDHSLPEHQRATPVANTCFPNDVVLALGDWGEKPYGNTRDECPKPNGGASSGQPQTGICLIGPEKSRWHGCPGCAGKGESAEQVHARLLRYAGGDQGKTGKGKGALELPPDVLRTRYGLKID